MAESLTIQQLLVESCQHLNQVAGDNARLESEILLTHVLQVSRTHLIAWPEKQLSDKQVIQIRQLVARRRQGEPIAYLTGTREFWSLALAVTPDTLIPRADTECLVERALALIPEQSKAKIADLGTGSGAIALAIAHERRGCQITATDHSAASLAVARSNAEQLQLTNLQFLQGNWCQALPPQATYDLIASNPPYIAENDPHLQQGDLPFEPIGALISGPDGLDDIRLIASEAKTHLNPGGGLLLEHGAEQGPTVREILQQQGYQHIQTLQDWEQRDRLTEGFTHL
ncbi:MAG: peptide chain release factor N(5)-glutamine methyltransferase [Chromatiales bacterium]|nr:peptide chain release factor N(5)-glutamine methyltransferase [Chromatiales bacterium]